MNKFLTIIGILCFGVGSILAQTVQVSGTVTSAEDGQPLPGVTIVLKGTTQGTMTDMNGKYTIGVFFLGTSTDAANRKVTASSDAILQFSCIGMETQEIAVGGRNVIDVKMVESALSLSEVNIVAIGYGHVKRRDLTGSISSVSGDQLKEIPVASAAQAIVGRMPGVNVTRSDGSPDAEIRIRVRGGGSITQDNSPLFILDGFPVDNINNIAPGDIQSIDVLKDASSTAIYGARGANGVIIVTTRSGSEGRAKINYNMYYGRRLITKYLDVLSPYEYVLLQHEIQAGATSLRTRFGHPEDYYIWKDLNGSNWQHEAFGGGGSNVNHNLSVTGGTSVAKYNISFTRNDFDEIMMGSGYDITSLLARTTFDAKEWLRIDLTTSYSSRNVHGQGTSGDSRLSDLVQYRPIEGMRDYVEEDDDPNYDIASGGYFTTNPVEQIRNEWRRQNSTDFRLGGAIEIRPTQSLTFRVAYNQIYTNSENRRFYGAKHRVNSDFGRLPSIENSVTKVFRQHLTNTVTWSRKNIVPGHSLTLLAGHEISTRKSDVFSTSANYFPANIDADGAFAMTTLGRALPIVSINRPAENLVSVFGRFNYDYLGKYVLTGTLRADGSSQFAHGNRWGYFPSAAAAWRISDEDFMKATSTWLSNLKLRVSYGQAGNNNIDPDAWKKTFSVSSARTIYMDGALEAHTPYFVPDATLSNSKLKWETTITRNAGLDFGLFKDKVTGTVEVYKNDVRDLLLKANVPASTGYTRQWRNIGATSNRGIELNLESIIVNTRDFRLSALFNIGANKNRVESLGGEFTEMREDSGSIGMDGHGNDFYVAVGKPTGLMYGFQTDGWYTFDDFDYLPHIPGGTNNHAPYVLKDGIPTNRALTNTRRFMPGQIKYVLQDREDPAVEQMTVDGELRKWPIIGEDDKTIIGYAQPKHTGGFGFNGHYKSFDFAVFFNWSWGNDVLNYTKLNFATPRRSDRFWRSSLALNSMDNRWTYYDPETTEFVFDPDRLKEMNANATIWHPQFTRTTSNDWAVEDGSFLRLQNVTIGYSLPKSLLSRVGIQQLRVYVSGYNLWLWTNYSGFDPEVNSRRGSPLTPNVDYNAYPSTRSFNVGLSLSF